MFNLCNNNRRRLYAVFAACALVGTLAGCNTVGASDGEVPEAKPIAPPSDFQQPDYSRDWWNDQIKRSSQPSPP